MAACIALRFKLPLTSKIIQCMDDRKQSILKISLKYQLFQRCQVTKSKRENGHQRKVNFTFLNLDLICFIKIYLATIPIVFSLQKADIGLLMFWGYLFLNLHLGMDLNYCPLLLSCLRVRQMLSRTCYIYQHFKLLYPLFQMIFRMEGDNGL